MVGFEEVKYYFSWSDPYWQEQYQGWFGDQFLRCYSERTKLNNYYGQLMLESETKMTTLIISLKNN